MLKWFGSYQNFSFTPSTFSSEVASKYAQALLIIFKNFVLFALCVEQNRINLIKGNSVCEFLERQSRSQDGIFNKFLNVYQQKCIF